MIEVKRFGKLVHTYRSSYNGLIEIGKNTILNLTEIKAYNNFHIKIGDNNKLTGLLIIREGYDFEPAEILIKHNNILHNIELSGEYIKIGSKCKIQNVKLGKFVTVKNNVFISNTRIGKYTKIHPHAVIMNSGSIASVCLIGNHAKVFGKIELETSVIGPYKKCYRFEKRKGISSGIYYDEYEKVIIVGTGNLNKEMALENKRIFNTAKRLLDDYKDLKKCYEYLN